MVWRIQSFNGDGVDDDDGDNGGDDEYDNEIIIPDDIITMDGTKINLKKDKPVYKGIKAKIMKNYKQK